MPSPTSSSESSMELKKLRRRIHKLLTGTHQKHSGTMKGIKEALKVARRVAIRCVKNRSFKRALESAYAETDIRSKSGSTPFTQLAKYLFPQRDSTNINRYARVLAVADELGWSPSELRARLDDESITAVADRYKSKTAKKDPGFDWNDVKRALSSYGSFRTVAARERWRVALVHFSSSGTSVVYRLPKAVRPDVKILAKRACKAKTGSRRSER